ncbi:MAG: hypothetical protein EAZ09_14290 [Oscillatoriales cyanobacterium]|nr:MAG: hypothetical protein EAZ18_12345 [Oscillatoriales cyanobacterium]TAH20451.1 MAG: hypothetical protein EAZ09_14290 [Oscillatoriales cyanobacterium]
MTTSISSVAKSIKTLKTPQILQLGLQSTWVMSILLMILSIAGVQVQRQAVQTIGKDAAPSILDAQRINDSLADLDANVANELIAKPGKNPAAVKAYGERQEKLSKLLVGAAENITYGDAERLPIQTLQLQLGNYMMMVQQARDHHQRGDTNAMLAAYRSSAEAIDKTLLPTAAELDEVNWRELERIYAQQQKNGIGSIGLILVSGAGLVGVLVALQLFLNLRMRRRLNPFLLLATILAVGSMLDTTRIFLSTGHHLKVAKEDAFTSLHALRQGRAIAYIANAAESRYLLDKAFVVTNEETFFKKVDLIAKLPSGMTYDQLLSAVKSGQLPPGFTGFMADELKNITFQGERDAAVNTLDMFGRYLAIDTQIRQLEKSGQHQAAVTLCIGTNPGQSNWAFEEFKKAHSKTMDINQAEFDRAIEASFNTLNGFEIKMPILIGAIALFTFLGLRPRMREYSL